MTLASEREASKSKLASVTVAIVFTAYMAVVFGLGLYLFSLLASEMRQTLRFETQTIRAITAAAQIAFLVAAVICPHLTRRFGEGRVIVAAVMIAGVILSMVSTTGSAQTMAVLVGALGATAAFMVIPTVGVISRTVAFQYRSRVNGLVSSGTAYGQFAAGSIAPWLVLDKGWRAVWLVLGIASVLVAVAGFVALKAVAPSAFATGADTSSEPTNSTSSHGSIFNRTNLVVWALLAASGMACGPWQNYLSTYLGGEHGLSISVVGQLWSIVGFLGLFSGFAIGLLADRIGIKSALSLSYGLLASSAVMVALHSEVGLLYAAAVFFGLSFFAVYGLIPAYITKTVNEKQTTAVFAGANICLGVGTAIGNLGSGFIPALTGSLQQVYFCIAAVAVAAALSVSALPRERRGEPAA
ncbi:MAG: MFS transporter [Pseudomonadota bacterium]